MKLGMLDFVNVYDHLDLVVDSTRMLLESTQFDDVYVSEIDPTVSDTVAFCEKYAVGMDVSANCVIIEAKRADKVWYVACMILATDRIDVNGVVRRCLDARKTSFAAMDIATKLTGMEYGGINPIGVPNDCPILVDSRVANTDNVLIGSGVRRSKLLVPGKLLGELPNAVVMDIVKVA